MKRIFKVLVVFVAITILLSVFGIGIVSMRNAALEKECRAYVDQIVPAILTDMSVETLSGFASDEMLSVIPKEELEEGFTCFSKLGEFNSYIGCDGRTSTWGSLKNGRMITGDYVAQADFETGPATVELLLLKKEGQWSILGFHINSEALLAFDKIHQG
ncbi:MAG: hypothetical protein JW920_12400 [Deltaproteobacteria bacterium]|nr:hypothetical protein [Deltaproteobacteria bacterium]